jgi:hypothetical protein
VAVRKLGLYAALICTDAFAALAELQLEALGCADQVELVVLPHPLGGISDAELDERVSLAVQEIGDWLDRVETGARAE